ncbi:MAG: type II secretion system F family protein [Candidatus Omnitrophota bacterium]|nr:type II secretion system F family protein [Candidatus Omnitrophota bacterium]MDZ4241219.1 type II secretion system F family protein [Candidatus Omnitrophota bacterium]
MAKFRYTVKDSQGQTVTADTESYDRPSLIQQLQRQGFFIIKVEEVSAQAAVKTPHATVKGGPRKFHHKGLKLNDLLTFSRQLTTMLESGVTLLRSLEVITSQVDSEKLYRILIQVTKDVEHGSSLSEALAKHPRTFNQFWVSLMEVGEASGTMPMVLNKLAFYLEQQASFRSTIISAIMYPAVLFCVCLIAIAFFALFVGPKFEEIFTQMNVDLPLITRILLKTFNIIKENFKTITIGLVIGIFFLKKYFQTPLGRVQKEKFFFSLPTVGNIYRLIVIERFTSQMAILVDSGVPILHALDISQRLVDNITCAKVIGEIKEGVRQGELLVSPMQRSQFFPGMCIQMITVGEETGELSKMLKHVAAFYQETVETFMKRLGTLIEPLMLVFMGAVIGVIVLAMFLPMFNISQLGGASGE